MKKFLIASAILLTISVFALALIFPQFNTVANKDKPSTGDDPDRPGYLQNDMSDLEYREARAEYIALKRGLDKDSQVDPNLRLTAIARMEEEQTRIAAMEESFEKNSLTAAWTEIGPNPIPNGQVPTGETTKPVSGRTVAIAVHPTNPNLVYVGTAQGGLYRSLDGGTTWTTMIDTALSIAVNTVAIAPSQPDTIFVGTGESGFSGDAFFGAGIYRIDNASTATPTVVGPIGGTNFTGRAIGKIVVHPTDANTIFASSTSGIGGLRSAANNVLAARGIFRSTDALSAAPTFTKLTLTGVAAQDRNVLDIVMDPGNPSLVLCTVADSFSLTEGGVYRSTDALVAAPTFVRTFTAGVGTDASRTELALHRSATGGVTVYAASGFMGGTLQRSIDGGATFTQRIDNNFCSSQCFYDIAVEVDPTNADRVYLGGSPTLVFGTSTNGGTSFTTPVNSGLHVDTHAITVAPSLPSTVYFGSDGGIYKSLDSGTTWASLNNTTFRATQFTGLAVHPIDPNFTIGGTQDNGTNFYQPSATWFRVDFGDGGYAVIDQSATDNVLVNMYHTYFNSGTLKGYGYVPGPATAMEGLWTFRGCQGVMGNGIPCGGSILFYAPLEQGPGTPNTIYYGADTLYRSADTGLNHTAVSQNFGTSPISAIGISPQNDNVRIVGLTGSGTTPGGLFGTTTGAAVLTDLDAGNAIPNNAINRTVIDPNNVNTAYVTLSVFGANNVFRTTNLNAGAPTWTPLVGTGGNVLPQVPVSAFIVDPANSSILYAGTDIGVYISSDSGANWFPFGTGLPRVAVFDMAKTAGGLIRIATHGRGMWQITAGPVTQIEADVAPRSEGDGSILSNDVVQIRRFVNGTNTPSTMPNEFQRADSDPFASKGDGLLNSADVVQTRRYQNGTSPIQSTGGPAMMGPEFATKKVDKLKSESKSSEDELRQLRVENIRTTAGQTTVNILVNAVGDEAEYGFTLNYDGSVLSKPVIGVGNTTATVRACNTQIVGAINCSVGGFSNNQTGSDAGIGEIGAGENQILITVQFTIAANAPTKDTPLTLSNVNASTDTPRLFTPDVRNGNVSIFHGTPPRKLELSVFRPDNPFWLMNSPTKANPLLNFALFKRDEATTERKQ